ncbi:HK97-gp10 family putative phage morphogenesis protein [uncultured Alistipes sp.]|uniref:HK97-gp10 family putative phage morphogenesis protein n=1 Tax=uncultured Alistipes sp. TaxID=538949 RepID=UPI00258B655E|nr:HK97-gp10 family putative phage morphogenesis protein [uncultured Alistipes sp.]
MLTVKVEGYVEAKRILDELPNNMQKKMLLAALRSSAKPMLQSAKSKVPVRSGKLRKKLRIVRFKDRSASKSEVSVAVKPVFEVTKKKGAINEFYGKFIHEGTKDPRTSKKGKLLVFENERGEKVFTRSVKGIKATPFLEQAYTESNDRTVAMFGDELAATVEKFVARNFKPVIK